MKQFEPLVITLVILGTAIGSMSIGYFAGKTAKQSEWAKVTKTDPDDDLRKRIESAKQSGWTEDRINQAILNEKAKVEDVTLYEAALRKENGRLISEYNTLVKDYNGLRDAVLTYLAASNQSQRYNRISPITCTTHTYRYINSTTTTCY